MNRLGRYDVDAAFDRMSLQSVDEFGLDAILTMTHRLFLLRDDALFLRCLEYCWFVDTERRLRCAGVE